MDFYPACGPIKCGDCGQKFVPLEGAVLKSGTAGLLLIHCNTAGTQNGASAISSVKNVASTYVNSSKVSITHATAEAIPCCRMARLRGNPPPGRSIWFLFIGTALVKGKDYRKL